MQYLIKILSLFTGLASPFLPPIYLCSSSVLSSRPFLSYSSILFFFAGLPYILRFNSFFCSLSVPHFALSASSFDDDDEEEEEDQKSKAAHGSFHPFPFPLWLGLHNS